MCTVFYLWCTLMYLDKILDGISHFSTMKLCLDVEIQCRYKRLLWVSCVDECVSLYNYCAGSSAFKNVEMCIRDGATAGGTYWQLVGLL